ncbi:unnamed protein product [Mytilus edulis]|uniref:Uncharacterized protein n=1 Tax=Mytilus edulis TaxID=6550 RepID=A0A8S3SPS1_MYTED|nr:unnamed protein product [Mytilus edulis]
MMSRGDVEGDICEASGVTRTSTRQRGLTDKGFLWQVDTLQKNFRKAVSSWKSWSNKIEVQLSDTKDTNIIREHRNILVENMNHLTSVYKQLSNLIENESESHGHSELISDTEIFKRYETCENYHADLMKRITTRVQEIDRDNVETRGSYTCKSRSSHSSHFHRSSASQRSQTASRAADLKAKLKYIEIEAKAKLKLERIQTIRELEATEAKLDVIDKASQGSDLDELKKSLPQANILDKFLQHVNPYAKVDTDIENIKDEHDDFVTTLPRSAVPKKLNIDHDQVQSIHNISYKYPVQGYSVPTASLQGQGRFVSNVDQSRQAKSTPNVRPLILDQSALNVSQSFVQSESSVPVMTHMRSEPVVTNVNSMPVVTSVSSATLNPSAITFVPQNVNTANVTGQYVQIEDLTKSLAEQVSLSRLPPPEPSVFFGDPLKYPAWKSSFQTLIEQRKIPTFERIQYLRKFVGDSVREVIENFLILSTEDAYDDAKELLEKRFGDPFIISNAFRDRLDN